MNKILMMQKDFYLVVGAKKARRYGSALELCTPRIVVGKGNQTPKVNAGEIAIRVTIELPESLFKKPAFKAKVSVPADSVTAPIIDASVVNNIAEIVAAETGIHLTIEQCDGRL